MRDSFGLRHLGTWNSEGFSKTEETLYSFFFLENSLLLLRVPAGFLARGVRVSQQKPGVSSEG